MQSTVAIDPVLAARFDEARHASRVLGTRPTAVKDAALEAIAAALLAHEPAILAANEQDIAAGRADGLGDGLLDRLTLTPQRVTALADAVRDVVRLEDPVGESIRGRRLPNGIRIEQVRVPLGVVGAIYEARPNVTVDIAALAIKSGNAVVLRGGSAAERTNHVLVGVLREGLATAGLPEGAVQTVDDFGREGARAMMHARGRIDVLIPRGSAGLIETVVGESTVPVIETGAGVVHMFLDESAPLERAVELVHNAKVQRPSVCNALETVLVHRAAADRLLPAVLDRLIGAGVLVRGDDAVRAVRPEVQPAGEEDYATEHMSLELSMRVVDDLDEALAHIDRYSTRHTEAIVTDDLSAAERFLAEVDAAAVMVNTSTRFTDGGEFGFGAEVGISTQKLHARGPMGLPELTSSKWLVRGDGQVRG
ncbi:glutamate-5-semialdehyde dehydrogenase [Agromyces sp. SYSU T00194]|uniref:glutamate-5-semialdehyde dehydrogenase n=1 Tax=Agromyces chitinivorans TaxID=3158560 RepID=UPI00339B7C0B